MFNLNEILKKDKITIVITDSGLGGMSVCAGIEQRLRGNNSYQEANLIFFNALPERGMGYNSMPSIKMKANVFNQALISMEKNFSPDIILIACNTLSIVYPWTQFAQVSKTPVLGIVEFGVSMILSALKMNPDSEVLILGTQTTIKSETHKKRLLENGIKENKIINQACPDLETEIQLSPESIAVKSLVNRYLKEAISKSNSANHPIIANLCCTHYGFSKEIFYSYFRKLTEREVILLNPNELMIDSVIIEPNRPGSYFTKMNVQVVSRSVIKNEEKQSIGRIIKANAPLSSAALMNYEFNPNLFEFHIS